VVWFTGLSGAGKSTISRLTEDRLYLLGKYAYILDGDDLRRGLNKDLGFTDEARAESVRRAAEVARHMATAGLIVLVSLISPFRVDRQAARDLIAPTKFVEIFVDTPITVAEARDTKGLYSRARRGEVLRFTGLDSPYEHPERPEMHLRTTHVTAQECADAVVMQLAAMGVLRV
jgi:bifunctional enzyme CysN/CysC